MEVPLPVFEGLEAVQQLGQTSMLDHQAVQDLATRIGYPEAALWVREHRDEYSEGLFRGSWPPSRSGSPIPPCVRQHFDHDRG